MCEQNQTILNESNFKSDLEENLIIGLTGLSERTDVGRCERNELYFGFPSSRWSEVSQTRRTPSHPTEELVYHDQEDLKTSTS